jgi:hypothetical protein
VQDEEENPITLSYYGNAKKAIERIMDLCRLKDYESVGRQALSNELFLQEKLSQHWQVFLKKDNQIVKVVWPNNIKMMN